MSISMACRAGRSNAFTTPRSAASRKTCHICTFPVRVSAARMNARTIEDVWVAITTCFRPWRSAVVPPRGAIRNTGICAANPTAPSRREEPVSLYTSHDWAMTCIQVPISEISCPPKKSWKLRCRKARKAAGSLLDDEGLLTRITRSLRRRRAAPVSFLGKRVHKGADNLEILA